MPNSRRTPLQPRSRERVKTILDVASELIVEHGVEGVTTSEVAKRSGISVGALYQYFADRDAIIARLLKDDVERLNAKLVEDFAQLTSLALRTIVETAMATHVAFYRENPRFVQMWVRGRSSAAVLAEQRSHIVAMSKWLRAVADKFEMVQPDAPELGAWFAVEIADRILEMAFRRDPCGNPEMIKEGTEMIIVYLDRFATGGGRSGVKIVTLPQLPG